MHRDEILAGLTGGLLGLLLWLWRKGQPRRRQPNAVFLDNLPPLRAERRDPEWWRKDWEG